MNDVLVVTDAEGRVLDWREDAPLISTPEPRTASLFSDVLNGRQFVRQTGRRVLVSD